MKLLKRFRLSPGMVIACLALLLALGGTGYAASQALPRNSVTSVQVKDRSLLAKDFKTGQLPRGPAGPCGSRRACRSRRPRRRLSRDEVGAGACRRWHRRAVGRHHAGGAPIAGTYVLNFASAATGHAILASGGYAGDNAEQRGETTAGPCGGGAEGMTCPTGFDTTSHIFVQTRTSAGTPGDHSFYVAVFELGSRGGGTYAFPHYDLHVRVSAKVDYALRAVIELAASGDGPVKGERIAQAQEIPLRVPREHPRRPAPCRRRPLAARRRGRLLAGAAGGGDLRRGRRPRGRGADRERARHRPGAGRVRRLSGAAAGRVDRRAREPARRPRAGDDRRSRARRIAGAGRGARGRPGRLAAALA